MTDRVAGRRLKSGRTMMGTGTDKERDRDREKKDELHAGESQAVFT